MKRHGLICLSLFILVACENAPVRREEVIAQHPEWDEKTVQLVRGGYLAKGMDKEQVRAAWGRPCLTCTGTTKGDWGESWEYPTQVVFFDKDGKVTHWDKK